MSKTKDLLAKTEKEREKLSLDLQKTSKEYESLKQKHDEEVTELFENKDTLKFVKQMKFYKQQWGEKTGDDDRKQIATQMASTTKNWVSVTDKKEEDE